jgi:hypothetical protein
MKQNKITGKTDLIETQFLLDKLILKIAKQRKQIIYGARSIEKQAGLFSRPTKDYDIFDKNPKKSAQLMQKILDKSAGFDQFYMKEAEHKGTWKVKSKGNDGVKNTEDDESIADYTKPEQKIKFVIKNGVRYRILKEELKKKVSTVQDPEFKFRHEKDRDDIKRIKGYIKVKNLIGGEVG